MIILSLEGDIIFAALPLTAHISTCPRLPVMKQVSLTWSVALASLPSADRRGRVLYCFAESIWSHAGGGGVRRGCWCDRPLSCGWLQTHLLSSHQFTVHDGRLVLMFQWHVLGLGSGQIDLWALHPVESRWWWWCKHNGGWGCAVALCYWFWSINVLLWLRIHFIKVFNHHIKIVLQN